MQVSILAIMSDERSPAFPDVPTLKESGVDWSNSYAWRCDAHIVIAGTLGFRELPGQQFGSAFFPRIVDAMAIFAGDIPGTLLRIGRSAAYVEDSYAMTKIGKAKLGEVRDIQRHSITSLWALGCVNRH